MRDPEDIIASEKLVESDGGRRYQRRSNSHSDEHERLLGAVERELARLRAAKQTRGCLRTIAELEKLQKETYASRVRQTLKPTHEG